MSTHRCKVYNSLKEFLQDHNDPRWARIVWKRHIDRNGNVPLLLKCPVCTGDDFKREVKKGARKGRRPSKRLRDEIDTRRDDFRFES